MIFPGFTFLSVRPSYTIPHLHIVISPPIDGKVLLVNVTTPKYDSDLTCVLRDGDHPFLTHDSVINYGDATASEVELLKLSVRTKLFTPKDPVSGELLKRIQAGALISPALPPKFIKYIPT
jgi:hypothetical protein